VLLEFPTPVSVDRGGEYAKELGVDAGDTEREGTPVVTIG